MIENVNIVIERIKEYDLLSSFKEIYSYVIENIWGDNCLELLRILQIMGLII